MRQTLGYSASAFVEPPSTFGFDAVSNAPPTSTLGTSPTTWTHTPVGIPKGVLVYVGEEISAIARVSAVTYGGVAMSPVAVSPQLSTWENGQCMEAYFLGSGLPTGAQTVSVTWSGSFGSLNACALTVVGPNNSAIEDTSVADTAGTTATNPTCALTIAHTSVVSGALWSGQDTSAAVTLGAGMSSIVQVDVGAQNLYFAYKAATTGSNTTVDWTAAISNYAILAVAIKST